MNIKSGLEFWSPLLRSLLRGNKPLSLSYTVALKH
jgi:hypothetical protein